MTLDRSNYDFKHDSILQFRDETPSYKYSVVDCFNTSDPKMSTVDLEQVNNQIYTAVKKEPKDIKPGSWPMHAILFSLANTIFASTLGRGTAECPGIMLLEKGIKAKKKQP